MKKFLSLFVAVALMISTFLPFQASAAEYDLTDQEELISLAKEIFPEYAQKLDGSRSGSTPQIATADIHAVVRETRTVDSNTTMTYTEHNNGTVTLGVARFMIDEDLIIDDSQTFNTFTQYTATIIASVVEGPTFTATNVRYRIYPSDYDRVISEGSYGIPGYSSSQFDVSINSIETASRAAYATYAFPTPVGSLSYSGKVSFHVRNNSASVEFDIW